MRAVLLLLRSRCLALGGAVARVGEGETAFNGRGAGHTFNPAGGTESASGFAEEREWARKQKYDPDNFFRLNPNIPPS